MLTIAWKVSKSPRPMGTVDRIRSQRDAAVKQVEAMHTYYQEEVHTATTEMRALEEEIKDKDNTIKAQAE